MPYTRLLAFVVSLFVLPGLSCAQTPEASAPANSAERNVIESNGFRLHMDWCEVRSDRSAECQLTATSLTQDFKAGLAYPILQDQTGAQYRMVPKEGGLGRYVMVAGEPYTLTYVNKEILPTTVESVRSVVGSWTYWVTATNLRAGAFPVALSDIPVREVDPTPEVIETVVDATQEWETVGFWTYDAQDGLRVPEGLVLIDAPGALGAYRWASRLELTAHQELQNRTDRILWPVFLNRTNRQVCVDAPYPSYSGFIDFEDDAFDGVYAFATCVDGAPQ